MNTTLLDTAATAARIGIARSTLAKMRVYGGGPPYVKVGAKVLYAEADVEAWLVSQPRHSSTAAHEAEVLRERAQEIAARRRAAVRENSR